MVTLLLRVLGLAVCLVAAALIYLEAGAAEEPFVMPRGGDTSLMTPPPPAPQGLRAVRFFFGGGGKERSVAGVIHGVRLEQAIALGIPRSSLQASEDGVRFAFFSPSADLVGFAVVLPPGALQWEWTLDGSPWPRDAVFAGPYGLLAPDLVSGIGASCADGFASGAGTPFPSARQTGAFVICQDR